jgi:hypothetical protein
MRVQNPRELAASFALAVTEETIPGNGIIAKNGEESLFRTLQLLLPQVWSWDHF